MPSRSRPAVEIVCVCCGKPGFHLGRGLIRACYARHHWRGDLAQFPTRKVGLPAWTPHKRKGLAALAQYTELVAAGASRTRIRWAMSLGERQITRYAAAYRLAALAREEAAA